MVLNDNLDTGLAIPVDFYPLCKVAIHCNSESYFKPFPFIAISFLTGIVSGVEQRISKSKLSETGFFKAKTMVSAVHVVIFCF
jgi:hypothetical protein